ncbi:putative trehalose-6-phosphate phosphatase [Venustampulla echinocandica]|uniref:Putative trehalose-6-phosphate phosphatase n=1 Tax=Venustampulla echinocandica TaxID=2656787 RepID=A0A370TG84_9HELO|nr:putative trehalose-6-phosphate phosphatase [Venustampulla echinocandica]RDL33895.1 putative trehalose-6-phosphate phosphatase [Venustampulla echinocandica]
MPQQSSREGVHFAGSQQTRPAVQDREESLHPGHRQSDTEAVTPWMEAGESSLGGDAVECYFTPDIHNPRRSVAETPRDAASGAKSNSDILQRMTRGLQTPDSSLETDPRAANPSLELSGGLISATFALPDSPQFRKGQDWTLIPRRGTSALFDSFNYLSSDKTPWNHTLVGWTGEIFPADNLTPPDTPPTTTTASKVPPLNKDSAPIPVDAFAKPTESQHSEGLWVSKEDQERLEWQLSHQSKSKTVPVWLSDDPPESVTDGSILLKDQSRWRRFAETELYTLFHYKQHEPTNGQAERASWADYYRMNQKFADKIMEIYKPGDIVMIHDYHLLLLPSMLRQRVPHMYISFFLHIPFPSSEFLLCLPRRKDVLEGILGANLVGFQSYSYLRHFVSCCTRILDFPSDTAGVDAYGTKVSVGVFPIGIDAPAIEKLAFDDPVIDDQVVALRKLYEGKKIIVGRDRLDSVRGVAQKLMAFERFLDRYPEWREKVVLIQVTSPTSIEEKKEDSNKTNVANQIAELVAKINGVYGSLGFSPVQHYPQYLSQEEYLALLRVADIGLITSVRDGMNTTSLEYVVCQRDGHGPLILSEFSGTAGSLKDAIHINPWDVTDVAAQIERALTMSDDMKAAMHQSLYHHVTTRNVQAWENGFLKRLLVVLGARAAVAATPLLDKAALIKHYRAAKKRLFMFDYDGTLTPIVKEPSAAVPSERVIRTLKALASDHRNSVWIISGRDQEFLDRYLGHISELGFSAEHGSFMRHPEQQEWENLAEKFDMSWQKEVMDVFQHYTEITPGSFIERKRCALTWHYRAADAELGPHQARECQKELDNTVAKKWDVEVMTGKANLEVRPTFINKGEIAKRLVASYGKIVGELPEFTLCLGDDFTDEDMFRALSGCHLPAENVFTVTVGASSKMTLAKYHLLEPADVVNTIALLNGGDTNIADLGPLGVVEGKIPSEMPGGVKIAPEKP